MVVLHAIARRAGTGQNFRNFSGQNFRKSDGLPTHLAEEPKMFVQFAQ
jgi:hypothetical protein